MHVPVDARKSTALGFLEGDNSVRQVTVVCRPLDSIKVL